MGKSYTSYKQARQRFMGPAFQKAAQNFSKLSGKTRQMGKKKKRSGIINGVLPPITIKLDTSQFDEAFRKLSEAMEKKSGKMFKMLTDAMLKEVSAAVCFNGHHMAIDDYLKFERRWLTLQALGWTQDPDGGLVSPRTLDIVDPLILDDEPEFKRFLDYYLATGEVGGWVPCRYVVVAVEKIALPLDSVRKQLEERISG